MKTWTFYWLTGQREVLAGETAADALNRAGYGRGAVCALDFFAEGSQEGVWAWNSDTRDWIKT